MQILTPSLLIPANYQTHANVILNPSIVTLNEVKSLRVNSVKNLKKSILKEILRPAKAGLKNDLMIFEESRDSRQLFIKIINWKIIQSYVRRSPDIRLLKKVYYFKFLFIVFYLLLRITSPMGIWLIIRNFYYFRQFSIVSPFSAVINCSIFSIGKIFWWFHCPQEIETRYSDRAPEMRYKTFYLLFWRY